MKKIIILFFVVMSVFLVCPVSISAKTVDFSHSFNLLVDTQQSCNSILGDVNDENSVAWLLQQVLNFIKVLGPILVVVLSSIDFTKVIAKSDDDAMAKAQKRLGMRLLLAVLLFLIPTLVGVMLETFNITSNCGIH